MNSDLIRSVQPPMDFTVKEEDAMLFILWSESRSRDFIARHPQLGERYGVYPFCTLQCGDFLGWMPAGTIALIDHKGLLLKHTDIPAQEVIGTLLRTVHHSNLHNCLR